MCKGETFGKTQLQKQQGLVLFWGNDLGKQTVFQLPLSMRRTGKECQSFREDPLKATGVCHSLPLLKWFAKGLSAFYLGQEERRVKVLIAKFEEAQVPTVGRGIRETWQTYFSIGGRRCGLDTGIWNSQQMKPGQFLSCVAKETTDLIKSLEMV